MTARDYITIALFVMGNIVGFGVFVVRMSAKLTEFSVKLQGLVREMERDRRDTVGEIKVIHERISDLRDDVKIHEHRITTIETRCQTLHCQYETPPAPGRSHMSSKEKL